MLFEEIKGREKLLGFELGKILLKIDMSRKEGFNSKISAMDKGS